MRGSLWRRLAEGYLLLGVWLFGDALADRVAEDGEPEPIRLVILAVDDEKAVEFVERVAAGLEGRS